jgi:hypothetical protein
MQNYYKKFQMTDLGPGKSKLYVKTLAIKGMATKAPTELPKFVNTTISNMRVILFFQNPFRDNISAGRLSKSFTFGFPIKVSTSPATHPAAIIGLRDVIGDATIADRMVSG